MGGSATFRRMARSDTCVRMGSSRVNTIRERAVTGLDPGLMFELLGRAAANDKGRLDLPREAVVDAAVVEVLGFLVAQRWFREDGLGR